MQSKIFFFILTGIIASFQSIARAFPEMVRKGYQNCTACHVAPEGGGLLTDYGRSMSAEILSTWNYKGEEAVGHGLLPDPPSWLRFGGDFRFIQSYLDNPVATTGRFFPMQEDLDIGLHTESLWLVGALGLQGGPKENPDVGRFVSHHFYAL